MANYDLMIATGHGKANDGTYDSGACANGYQEHLIAEQITNKVVIKLRNSGYNIHQDEQNYKDVDLKGNTYKYKMALSIHLNAGGGTRSEAYVPLGEKNISMEEGILGDLADLGIVNGGVRSREYNTGNTCIRKNGVSMGGTDYYKEIRDAWSLGVSLTILEVGFIDSSDIYIILDNIDKIAESIATRISILCDKPLIKTNVASTQTANISIKYRVKDVNEKQLNAYASLDTAKIFAEKNKAIIYDMNNKVVVSYAPSNSKYVNLKAHMTAWRVYPLDKAAVKGNECGFLNPSLGKTKGGLSYIILEDKGNSIYVINTSTFGKVKIYCPNDADGSVSTSPLYEFVN